MADLIAELRENLGVTDTPTESEERLVTREVGDDEEKQPVTSGRKQRSKRVTLNIVNGKIDLSRTPDTAVKQLSEAIAASPEIHKKLALPEKPQEFPSNLVDMGIGVVNMLEKIVMHKVLKIPGDTVQTACTLTEQQHDLLFKPAQEVMAKYLPQDFAGPEAALVAGLLIVGQQHYAACVSIEEHKKQQTVKSEPVN